MIAVSAESLALDLWRDLRRRLGAIPGRVLELPPELQRAQSADGRFVIRASGRLLDLAAGRAEARLALLRGRSLSILAGVMLPFDSQSACRVPLLAIEIMTTGKQLRLVFADLQDVGLSRGKRAEVAAMAMKLAPQRQAEPPTWAIAHSLGGYLFADRPDQATDAGTLVIAYLGAWLDITKSSPCGASHPSDDHGGLSRFKSTHASEWPGRPALERLFGIHWTHRFIHEFLYR